MAQTAMNRLDGNPGYLWPGLRFPDATPLQRKHLAVSASPCDYP
jgi:hypothetical protein